MKTDNDLVKIPIKEFLTSKQSHLFQTLKQPQFSGELVFNSADGKEWIFYLYLGRILYATGGGNNVRRWKRNLIAYAPQLIIQWSSLAEEINPQTDIKQCWEYDLLSFWLNKQEVSKQQVIKLIRSIIVEILFDLTQAMEVTFKLKETQPLTPRLFLIDPDQVIAEAWRLWQNWQGAKLADRHPNSAPIIKQKDNLRTRISAKTYQVMNKMFNGQNTLRDIAVNLQHDIIHFTKLLIPYIQLGFIELIEVEDISPPVMNSLKRKDDSRSPKGIILCVDDSFYIAETMKTILTTAGYKFLYFNNINLAIASILEDKPSLIFLDLDSSHYNAYEICDEIHKLFSLDKIHIVIMTNNLALVDRFRAKKVGCSDFLHKPIQSKALLDMINKYLKNIHE